MTKCEIDNRAEKWISMLEKKYLDGMLETKQYDEKYYEILQWAEEAYKRHNLIQVESVDVA